MHTYLTDGKLPVEAVSINGKYIEREVDGYKTLYTKGRESLAADVQTFEVGASHGGRVLRRRFPQRTITVGFILGAESASDLRVRFNALNGILNAANAKIVFADEQDKFFIGTPIMNATIQDRSNTVTAEFQILCSNPFKYSVNEFQVPEHEGVLTARYNGTIPARPVFDVNFSTGEHGECGFVVLSDARGHVLQAGDPEEKDTTTYKTSEQLVNDYFSSATLAQWTLNGGNPLEGHLYQGSFESKYSGGNYITPNSYGSDTSHDLVGPSIYKEIPADSNGIVGASTFEASYYLVWCENDECDPRCLGTHECIIRDEEGNIVAGVELLKWYSGHTANAKIYAGGKYIDYFEFDASYSSDWFGFGYAGHPPVRAISIVKQGAEYRFNIGGRILSYTIPEGKDMKAAKITFAATKYKGMGNTYPAMLNYLFWVKFKKHNVDKVEDVPNKFSAGDRLSMDCRDGSIKLNNLLRHDLGAVGNDWESLLLGPGENKIQFAYSAFTTDAPTANMRYREVFI